MKTVKGKTGLKTIKNPILTLGNFDGVHLGHQKILKNVAERAKLLGYPSVVYTFEPHPLKVVSPQKSPPLIMDLEDKVKLIESFGIDYLILARFTKDFAEKHPEEFAQEAIKKGLCAKEVWVGHDFSFGKGKKGTVEYLKTLGKRLGFGVFVIPAYKKHGAAISSSRVRELVKNGDVEGARALLGRFFSIKGKVVKGSVIGTRLGYPTANIKTGNELIPKNGVYAVHVFIEGRRHNGATNIGVAPTFKREKPSIETYILDFNAAIYGKSIRICFVKRLREELCFKSTDELIGQIKKDVRSAKRILEDRKNS